jgi:hypothetical protein
MSCVNLPHVATPESTRPVVIQKLEQVLHNEYTGLQHLVGLVFQSADLT